MKKRHILAILLIGVIFFFPLDLFSNLSYLKQQPLTGKSIFSELFSPLKCKYSIEIKNKLSNNIGSFTKDNCDYNLKYNNNKVQFKNLKSNIKAYIDKPKEAKFNSNAIFIQSASFDQATITLEKQGIIQNIYKCSNNNFNLREFSCSSWEKTSIPFTQTENTVTFTVNSFSVYVPGSSIPITVNANNIVGSLPEVWEPGIALAGMGIYITPLGITSNETLNMWNQEIGFNRGLHEIFLKHWRFREAGANLEVFGQYVTTVLQNGGQASVRLVGTPCDLSDYCPPEEGEPSNYYGYMPNDLNAWENMIYDELKYIVIGTDENGNQQIVNNYLLFNDNNNHATLGLGDDILFSLWYGIWGVDQFQFKGTQEEFFALWNVTYHASKRLEQDYPGINIKIGGFGFPQLDVIYPEIGMWDSSQTPGYTGFVYNLINYSHDPNGDGNYDDTIPIDWLDYQFRAPNPFAVSRPRFWVVNQTGQIRTYLEIFGYNPNTLVMADVWHGANIVMGLYDTFGNIVIDNGLEAQTEIDAALNPARLYDMELANQQKQVREAMQDFAEYEYQTPFFVSSFDGGIGIVTLGLESQSYLGLKKATFNSFKLIDMLGDKKLFTDSIGEGFFDNDFTVNAYATKNSTDNSIRVLIWTYISPSKYTSLTPDNVGEGEGESDECIDSVADKVCYNDLYNSIENDIGSNNFTIDLFVGDLTFNTDNIKVERYLVDKYHSNAFEYRYDICWALLPNSDPNYERGDCAYQLDYSDPTYPISEINQWTFNNNPYVNDPINNPSYYNISVGLEKVEDYTIENTQQYNKELSLLPYSVTLLILTPMDSTESYCGDGIINGVESCDCGADLICNSNELNGNTCNTLGYTGGTLSCTSNCQFNTTSCTSPPPVPPGDNNGGGRGGSNEGESESESESESQLEESRFDVNLFDNTEYRILSSIETLLITTDNIHEHPFIINNIYEDHILFSLDDLQSTLYINESRLFTLDNIDIQVFLDSISNGNAQLTFKRVSELPLRTLIRGRVWPYIDVIIGLAFLISILVLIKSYKQKYRTV